MRLALLVLVAAMAIACANAKASARDLGSDVPRNDDPKNRPSSALIERVRGRKNEIDGEFAGLSGAKNSKLRSRSSATVGTNSQREAEFKSRSSSGSANRVKGSGKADLEFNGRRGRKEVEGTREGNKRGTGKGQVRGGSKIRTQNIEYENVRKGADADIHMENSKGREADATFGRDQKGTYKGKKGTEAKLTVDSQNKRSGEGDLSVSGTKNRKVNGDYRYTQEVEGRNDVGATLKDKRPAPGRSSTDFSCDGSKSGLNRCANARQKTGAAVVDDQNGVYLTDSRGNTMSRVATKDGTGRDRGYKVTEIERPQRNGRPAREPLYLAKAGKFEQKDCYREVAKKSNPTPNAVKFHKPMEFVYNSKSVRGKKEYNFPDCFTVSGEVTLGKGVRVDRLAMEMRLRLNPLGDLACADPGTCGRGDCYYCHLCDEDSSKLEILNNVDAAETCSKEGAARPTRVRFTNKYCPIPETDKDDIPACPVFQRPYTSNFWTSSKENSIVAHVLFWHRPASEEELRDNFFSQKKSSRNFISRLRAQYYTWLLSTGKIKRGAPRFSSLEEHVLLDYYMRDGTIGRKDDFKEKLLACERGELDYDLAGSKTGGKFLVEAADSVKNEKSITDNAYQQGPCREVASIQKKEYDRLENDWKARGSPNGQDPNKAASLISGLLGGGGSSSGSASASGSSSSSSSGSSSSGGLFGSLGSSGRWPWG